jgi:raffinose/stachyose/melibiose transport system substrate-binding protein
MTRNFKIALLTSTLIAGPALAETTLTIESWRNDDLTIWQDTIIPAFEAQNPDIKVVFAPSAPAEYNAVLNSCLLYTSPSPRDH